MRLANILLISVLLLSGCSFSATERVDDPVPGSTFTSSPTDNLQLPSDTPQPTATTSLGSVEGERIPLGSECAQSIPGLREYQSSFELPDELYQEAGFELPIENGIDLSQYFSYLDKLSLEAGYALAYVYFADIVGGSPLVYAYPSHQPAYATYDDYIKAIGGGSEDQNSFSPLENANDYLAHIQIEDSPEGYLQFAALSLMGDQFYLFWHALYHDEIILCSADDLDMTRDETEGFQIDVPEDILQEARELDLEPYAVVRDDIVVVRFVFFTKWGGFVEVLATISRTFPHELIDLEGSVLIEYDCGIMF
jgi:hypothetical protein